jgi:excinuclease UvrABC nuclease subunit
MLTQLELQMREAAKKFEFEKAAQLRDRIRGLRQKNLSTLLTIESAPQAPEPAQTEPGN